MTVQNVSNLSPLLDCSTICGVVCKDGIILGTEKIVVNKMMISGTDKRAYSMAREIGCVSTLDSPYHSQAKFSHGFEL